ncbi:hypothetical protein ACFT7S_01380 [Streptomyces sp. NPDC057136]|uniref:hypothetical protein n=1 Tax=Streptomyces sp. NPDC057136 TaxID=3346029 RepID=UPI00362DA1A3
MRTFFMGSFVIATVVEVVVVAMLVRQSWRQKSRTALDRPVVRVNEVAAAAGLFGGTMVVVTLAAHGWGSLGDTDVLLFSATFGIVTAALIERIRTTPAANAAYALPVGFGLIAGFVGSSI